MPGARETRTAGPIGLSVVATELAGLHVPASRPHVSAVCKDRDHIYGLTRTLSWPSAPLASAFCMPG